VVEGNCRTTSEGVYQYATITRHSSSCDQMIREPAAAPGPQIVVTNSISAGRGVNEAAVPRVYSDVADPTPLRKQHQVTNDQ
jgi:hypothetical protein